MTDQDRLVLVAKVAGAFGVKGEVRLRAFTEDPVSLLAFRALRRADGSPGLTLTGGRADKAGVIARAKEVATKEQADALKGLDLYAPRSLLPPPEADEFYLTDLIGLTAVDLEGAPLGVVRAAPNYGAGDLLEIAPETGPSWLVGFTLDNVPKVDVAGGRVTVVRPPESD
jgi:16S rRNA processing protein RimM